MPLSTRAAIRRAIGEVTGWQIRGVTDSAGAADGTTIIDSTIYSKARDQHVRNRSVVCVTESTYRGQRRYATGPPSTAGAVTVSPAFGGQVATAMDYEIWLPDAPHPDQIDLCIDRALAEACWMWRPTPFSMLQYGDLVDDLTVSSADLVDADSTVIWDGTAVTPSVINLAPPDEFTRRAIRLTPSNATTAFTQGVTLEVDPDNRKQWWASALVRCNGAVTASLTVYDVTNAAAITLDEGTQTWTREGWGLLKSTFSLPTDCEQIAVRINAPATGGPTVDFAWVQMQQREQTLFSLPSRVRSKRHVGPVFVRSGNYFGEFKRRPWSGTLERREAMGRGVTIELDPPPGSHSLWFYEKTGYPTLTSSTPAAADDDNSTWCPLEWLRTAALAECYRFLRRRDSKEQQGRWDEEYLETLGELEALQADYGIEPMLTQDSAMPSGVAILPV